MAQIVVNFDERVYADVQLTPRQILWWETMREQWLGTLQPFSPDFFDATDHDRVFSRSAALPEEVLRGSEVVWGRVNVLDRLPRGGIAGEVGVLKGYFAQEILRRLEPAALHLFDIDFAPLDDPRFVCRHDPRLHLHQGPSARTLGELAADSFDYMSIDGDHTRPAVAADLELAAAALRPGGYLQLNDYTPYCYIYQKPYGVFHAVNQFLAARRWPVRYLALHPMGYHDIVIQKPI